MRVSLSRPATAWAALCWRFMGLVKGGTVETWWLSLMAVAPGPIEPALLRGRLRSILLGAGGKLPWDSMRRL